MAKIDDFQQKLDRYCMKQATRPEIAEIESWMITTFRRASFPRRRISLKKIEKETWQHISEAVGFSHNQRSLYPRALGIAASIALLIAGGMLYFNRQQNKPPAQGQMALAGPVSHQTGTTTTLELGNGEVIDLSGAPVGEIYSDHGIRIFNETGGRLLYTDLNTGNGQITASGQPSTYNRLNVPQGREYNITFSDGTKVLVGPASSLTFNPFVKDGRGPIELTGIAEFNVAKNANQSFEVMIPGQTIEVLGTQFNIRSYPGETEVTDLLSGAVTVSNRHDNSAPKMILKPGQRAISAGDSFIIETVDSVYLSKLSEGRVVFRNTPVKEVLRQIGRWYNVGINDSRVKDTSVTAMLYLKRPLDDVLETLRDIPNIKIEKTGQDLTAVLE